MEVTEEKEILKTVNPSTGETIKEHVYHTSEEVDKIIESSHEAFLKWRFKSIDERSEIIRSIGEKLQSYKNELAEIMTDEMGKLLSQSHQEVDLCTAICNYSADVAHKALEKEERQLSEGGRGIITYSPIGIVYGIQPWNYPAYQVVRYAITNLMAGNSILLKHASNVTGTAKMLETIFNAAGLPKNLFRVLIIEHDQSDKIVKHKLVRGVTLTGSADAGKKIGKKAASHLKKTVLELGSNDAYIVLDDADLDTAVEQCVKGRIYNNGETCIAAKRFIIVDTIYEQFKTKFVKAMKDLKLGDPKDEDTDIGPMAREDLRETLHKQVKKSVDKGATVLCGGKIKEGSGYFYPPTVLEHVEEGQPAYDDELFGPVAALIKARDTDDALRIANDSRFGLGGAIFSKDVDKAIELADKYFDTGMVFINSFGLSQPNMPFGGVKNSGYGREHGGFGMREFVNVKSILVN